LVAAIPHLRAFAVSLCHDVHRADDLVQETLVKGWQNRESFEAGTNFKAWLFTILRNTYFSERRRTKHVLVEANSDFVERLSQHPAQPGHLDLQDFLAALCRLKPGQREALVLVGAEGPPERIGTSDAFSQGPNPIHSWPRLSGKPATLG
jgi:RNA polymerase sigma-70 factor, ECF subfamily